MPKLEQSRLTRVKERLHHLFVGSLVPGGSVEPTLLQQFFHFWVLAGRSYVKNRLPVRAASLSYTTILALVPMLAVVMGISSSLLKDQSEERIKLFVDEMVESLIPPVEHAGSSPANTNEMLLSPAAGRSEIGTNEPVELSGQPSGDTNAAISLSTTNAVSKEEPALNENARATVARKLNQFIKNTRSGTLGTVGTLVLIFMAISMLIRIEDAFNEIWGIIKGRTLFMRLVLYWTVISLAPLMMIVAVGLASGPHLKTTERLIGDIPLVGWLLFQLLPIILLSVAFGIFYMLMPNTRVRWRAGLVGGVVAALLWHLNNSLSALFVSRVATNVTIYGGLALVPVFMVGLYFAWMILLFGGQVSYAWQNRLAYFHERISDNINQRGREFVALRLMTAIGATFQRGADAPTEARLSNELEVPPRLAKQVLQTLTASRLITEVSGNESAYVPARPIETITCHHILHAMRAGSGRELEMHDEPVHRQILGEFQRINEAERQAAESVTVLAMAQRANQLITEGGGDDHALTAGQSKEV